MFTNSYPRPSKIKSVLESNKKRDPCSFPSINKSKKTFGMDAICYGTYFFHHPSSLDSGDIYMSVFPLVRPSQPMQFILNNLMELN